MKTDLAIETLGYGLSGEIGGLPRQTYFTPDGRVIKAIPALREYVIKDKEGKVTDSGMRDANLDRGWLLKPPVNPKLFCQGCDRWHDTPEEVEECGHQQNGFIEKIGVKAKKEEFDKVSALEQQVANLTALVEKLSKDIKQ